MAADVISTVTIINNLSMASYQVTWSGSSPVGTLTVEASNDYSLNAAGAVANAGTWNTLPNMSAPVSGNTGNGVFDITQTGIFAIRLHYTRVSGSGTLNATINCKVA